MTDADFLRIVTGCRVLPGLTSGRESIAVCRFDGYSFTIGFKQ
jgi:hypothetical protein